MTYIQMWPSYTKEAVNFRHEKEKKKITSSYSIKPEYVLILKIFHLKLVTFTCIMISIDQENTKSKPENG